MKKRNQYGSFILFAILFSATNVMADGDFAKTTGEGKKADCVSVSTRKQPQTDPIVSPSNPRTGSATDTSAAN